MRRATLLKVFVVVLSVVALIANRATQGQVNQGQQIFQFDTFGDEQF